MKDFRSGHSVVAQFDVFAIKQQFQTIWSISRSTSKDRLYILFDCNRVYWKDGRQTTSYIRMLPFFISGECSSSV